MRPRNSRPVSERDALSKIIQRCRLSRYVSFEPYSPEQQPPHARLPDLHNGNGRRRGPTYRFDGGWLEMGGHEAGRPGDTRGVNHRYVAMVAWTSWLYVVMPAARPNGC